MTADEVRSAMVDRLRSNGTLVTSAVQNALLHVPRHQFIPGADLDTAYAETAVTVKTTSDGTAISSASQPAIVAAMLELTELGSGHRVLEIGTGTGYNAALLACLVGVAGHVVTVELEEDLAIGARERLRKLEFARVNVVIGDGADGHAEAAPYDRIIVTTGASKVAAAWIGQLRDGGRLVVPLVNSNGVGTIRCLVKQGEDLEEIANMPCGFLPMRAAQRRTP